jgi:crooked neck
LDRLPRSASASFHAAYTKFEKQHGTRSTAESTVMAKRRLQHEDEIAQDGWNYDAWFSFARLEEELHNLKEDGASEVDVLKAVDRVRDVYERAIAQVPPGQKRNWRRYIFLWIW